MIQRVQTIYMLASVIAILTMHFFWLASFAIPEATFELNSLGLVCQTKGFETDRMVWELFIVLLLMVAGAVLLFVLTGMKGSKFEYLEKNALDTAYGVSGMVRERMQREESDHTRSIAVGVVLCVLAAIPLFVLLLWRGEDEFYGVLGVSAILTLAAVGVHRIVLTSIPWGGYQVLLEQGDYTRTAKRSNRKYSGIYWGVVVAAYLAVRFVTMRWDRTWIVWPVAGVLYGVLMEIGKLRGK